MSVTERRLQVGHEREHAGEEDLKPLQDLVDGRVEACEQTAEDGGRPKAAEQGVEYFRDVLQRQRSQTH